MWPTSGIKPVDDIEGPIGSELERHRAEIGIGGPQERLDRRAGESGSVFLDAIAQDSLKADVVVQQVIALGVVGEVPAVDQLAAAGGPPLHGEELLHAAMFLRVDDLPGKCGAVIIRTAGRVGDEVLAPAVEVVAPRVGKPVGNEDVELLGPGFPAEDARLIARDAVRKASRPGCSGRSLRASRVPRPGPM